MCVFFCVCITETVKKVKESGRVSFNIVEESESDDNDDSVDLNAFHRV